MFSLIAVVVTLAAIGLNVTGNVLQVIALHFGDLALVQPLLVCDLLFAVLVAVAVRRRRPDRIVLGGVFCCAVGVASFLAIARPHGGHETVPFPAALPLVAALAAVLAGARGGPGRRRPLWLAAACGADFGDRVPAENRPEHAAAWVR